MYEKNGLFEVQETALIAQRSLAGLNYRHVHRHPLFVSSPDEVCLRNIPIHLGFYSQTAVIITHLSVEVFLLFSIWDINNLNLPFEFNYYFYILVI